MEQIYGTCSLNKFNQTAYLELALKFKIKYDLMAILAGAHIVPHQSTTYDKNLVIQAIHGVILKSPQLSCYTYKGPRGQIYYTNLSEIRLCIDGNGGSFINCPNPFNNCNARMTYWPI